MSNIVEPTNIGLSEVAHSKLKRLSEDSHFQTMVDAYRLAIALALAHGVIPTELRTPHANIFNVGTVDPEREIYSAIKVLMETGDTPIYRWAERLAEWGIEEISHHAEGGEIDYDSLLTKTVKE